MKKILALNLAACMALGLAACGNSSSTASSTTSVNTSSAETTQISSSSAGADDTTAETTSAATDTEQNTSKGDKPYAGQELVVQVWGGTYEETLRKYAIPAFEEETGATVAVVSGAAPLSQLATEGDEASIDILHLDTFEVTQGNDMDVLETLDYSKLENASDLYKEATEMYDTAVVTNWGTYGIVYRNDLVDKAPTSWLDLWDSAYNGGKIGVIDYSMGGGFEFAEAISRIQGSTISDKSNWDNLFDKLAELKPNIGLYASQHADVENALSNGDIVMSVETNGRAISLMKEGYDIKFCSPKEGAIAMTSLAGIAKGSQHKELAYKFLDVLLSTDVQKAYAENNYYAPSNSKTEIAEELQGYMPYGQDQVSALVYMDSAAFEPVKADFIDRWNQDFK